MWRDLELRELRIFLVLADELHFGRTAERLGISQPGVSEAVRVLESRLGVKVFDRTSRRVRLTPAGEELSASWSPRWPPWTRPWNRSASCPGPSAGCCGSVSSSPPRAPRSAGRRRVPGAVPGLRGAAPEVETFDAYRPLRRGDIDILCNWLAVDEPDLAAGAAFAYYQRALVVAATHRLAGQPVVSVEDLADEEVALLPPSTPPAVYDLLVPPRTPSGRPIRRTQPARRSTRSSRWWPAGASSTPPAPPSPSSTATT